MNEHERIDKLEDRILALENRTTESDAEKELEYIERFLIQSGYTVAENDVFATIISIIDHLKEALNELR